MANCKETNLKIGTSGDEFGGSKSMEVQTLMSEAMDYGGGNYVTVIEDATWERYKDLLQKMEQDGFEKHSDNGEGLYNAVFCSTYTNEQMVYTVTYIKRLEKIYISMCYGLTLSEHLLYNKKYIADNKEDAQTRLHLPEMWTFGNSFIFELKNGHFIISDGGAECETPYLLDYLENLVDSGSKPIIEAWFISHAHIDHCGVLRAIAKNPLYADKIYVEGIYFNEPNAKVVSLDPATAKDIEFIKTAAQVLKTTEGKKPEIYRPQTGQRYYFNDITVDIILTQEQILLENYYKGDFNDSSTWCMFNVEGQKCLLGGDGGTGAMNVIIGAYKQQDFELDMFATLHHCLNTTDCFTDYCRVKTAIFTRASEPRTHVDANKHLKDVSEEWFTRADGPRVLTFPYTVGTSEVLPHFEWRYNIGEEKPFS